MTDADSPRPPQIVILAGPNGAGKSTAAPSLLRGALGVTEFVNADVIARGLSAFDPGAAAFAAGRVMLRRMRELSARGQSFAFETTLASRSYAPFLTDRLSAGYRVSLVFLWLPNAEFAVKRVADRVRAGGHAVPEGVVRRRYRVGLRNFFKLYRPIATRWMLYDGSAVNGPILIARGRGARAVRIANEELWSRIEDESDRG